MKVLKKFSQDMKADIARINSYIDTARHKQVRAVIGKLSRICGKRDHHVRSHWEHGDLRLLVDVKGLSSFTQASLKHFLERLSEVVEFTGTHDEAIHRYRAYEGKVAITTQPGMNTDGHYIAPKVVYVYVCVYAYLKTDSQRCIVVDDASEYHHYEVKRSRFVCL